VPTTHCLQPNNHPSGVRTPTAATCPPDIPHSQSKRRQACTQCTEDYQPLTLTEPPLPHMKCEHSICQYMRTKHHVRSSPPTPFQFPSKLCSARPHKQPLCSVQPAVPLMQYRISIAAIDGQCLPRAAFNPTPCLHAGPCCQPDPPSARSPATVCMLRVLWSCPLLINQTRLVPATTLLVTYCHVRRG
jgi:hypothetical protein